MAALSKIDRNDVLAASARIVGSIEETPLIEARIRGHKLWLKCENRQTGGAFKLRGATNRLLLLSAEERSRGVVAFSSGNHAQGVAIAARRLGINAIIVMPSDAPTLKVEGTKAQGAEVVFYDRRTESREAIAAALAGKSGAIVVPSFDDPHIVAGQGTVGVELSAQLGRTPRRIVIPCGGGGLAAGIAVACPDSEIVIVEPDGWDDMRRSIALGEIVPVEAGAPATLCDALQTPRVSPITFDILQGRNAKALAVSEADVVAAVKWLWDEHRLIAEPGGSVAIAAILSGKVEFAEDTVAIVSGGNIDPALHEKLIA
ncbi:threonine/serine dehydratase [Sphingomonas sp. LY29]|uniref:threonine ammonia-lyase n=1 Tax=Sphingomonas sp. LY29 TaxID=3095341 RepID=UPI002D798762|nr:threonine/serine dehydratase [Sphingomonas sp. LY29]WRP26105.1 threonine/serine dehydratase [Sphingomonas sp. LY29]